MTRLIAVCLRTTTMVGFSRRIGRRHVINKERQGGEHDHRSDATACDWFALGDIGDSVVF
jgi:hypothetical protein